MANVKTNQANQFSIKETNMNNNAKNLRELFQGKTEIRGN